MITGYTIRWTGIILNSFAIVINLWNWNQKGAYPWAMLVILNTVLLIYISYLQREG